MTTPLTVHQKWERTKRWLRRRFTPPGPVRIRLVCGLHNCAVTCESENAYRHRLDSFPEYFHVQVRKEQSHTSKIDSLLHEWAHVLTWCGLDDDPHGEEWGLAHSRIYRAWCDWDYGQKKKLKDIEE